MTPEFERKLAYAALSDQPACTLCGELMEIYVEDIPLQTCWHCWNRYAASDVGGHRRWHDAAIAAALLDRALTALSR